MFLSVDLCTSVSIQVYKGGKNTAGDNSISSQCLNKNSSGNSTLLNPHQYANISGLINPLLGRASEIVCTSYRAKRPKASVINQCSFYNPHSPLQL